MRQEILIEIGEIMYAARVADIASRVSQAPARQLLITVRVTQVNAVVHDQRELGVT